MNPEKLEKYITDARRNKTSDIDIRDQLIVGGWNPEQVDAALRKSIPFERPGQYVNEVSVVHQPALITAFLTVFIILLVVYNFVTYSGQILGIADSPPVSNTELVAGLIVSFVLALVLAYVYTIVRRALNK